MNDIVKVIYVFKNDLPDQFVAIFVLSSKLTPCEVIFIVQPNSLHRNFLQWKRWGLKPLGYAANVQSMV